jgi:acylglycerol lipase
MATPQADSSAMVTETEAQVSLTDGLSVYTKTWSPASPVAQIFFLHGFSDHCNAYYDLPKTIAQSGIEFFSFDQRGMSIPLKISPESL